MAYYTIRHRSTSGVPIYVFVSGVWRDMILSSSPAFKIRGPTLGPRKLLHIM